MVTACPQHVHNMFKTGPQNVRNVNLLRPSPGALRSNAVVKQPADRWWAPHAPVSKKRYARIIHMAAEEKPGFPLNRGDGIGDPFAIERQTAGALPAHCESRDGVQDLLFPRRATAMKFAEPSNAPVPESQPERTTFRPPAPKTPAMVQVKTSLWMTSTTDSPRQRLVQLPPPRQPANEVGEVLQAPQLQQRAHEVGKGEPCRSVQDLCTGMDSNMYPGD